MQKNKVLFIFLILVIPLTLASRMLLGTAPPLGTVQSFAVLGASKVENTGFSILNGDLGIDPSDGLSVTGFPPGIVNGATHFKDGVSLQAQNDATTVYNNLAGQACDTVLTGKDLGTYSNTGVLNPPLAPGVYCFSTSAQLTGNLVLDAAGDPNAVWIFQIGSTLTTATDSSVTYINSGGSHLCNVFWQVGSSATLGTRTNFIGNIFAYTSVTMVNDANLAGRAVALHAAVTLDDNTITPVVCYVPPAPIPTRFVPAGDEEVEGLPDAGGGVPIRDDSFPWGLAIMAGFIALGLFLGVRTYRNAKQ